MRRDRRVFSRYSGRGCSLTYDRYDVARCAVSRFPSEKSLKNINASRPSYIPRGNYKNATNGDSCSDKIHHFPLLIFRRRLHLVIRYKKEKFV